MDGSCLGPQAARLDLGCQFQFLLQPTPGLASRFSKYPKLESVSPTTTLSLSGFFNIFSYCPGTESHKDMIFTSFGQSKRVALALQQSFVMLAVEQSTAEWLPKQKLSLIGQTVNF